MVTDAANESASSKAALEGLNEQQRLAVLHADDPLLIIAGAGTGKTRTLVHRVASGIGRGVDPSRILLLTFTRRAAGEMLRRVDHLLRDLSEQQGGAAFPTSSRSIWGGTFHSVATRLLRIYGESIGLEPAFTIHDRSDSEDLLDVVRTELNLARTDKRFPKKGTCMAIYSHCVNARRPLEEVLKETFPWCSDYSDDLKRLFTAYGDRKEQAAVLDYDDLLLFWLGMLQDPEAGERVRRRFQWVLVDEYQDTNYLQAEILKHLCPQGRGLAVVGDDAQSVYSFRAATVRNILDFPIQFPGTEIIKLEHNYRSRQAILDATNDVIAQSRERFEKNLWSTREGGERPSLITCHDEDEQAAFLIQQILEHREAGIDLRQQAVLFRASHHSMLLETELARRNIPFMKYGGLKFMEAGHVKDLMAFLRLAENPRDVVAATRILMLLPGVGPKHAQRMASVLAEGREGFLPWKKLKPPAAAAELWPQLVEMMQQVRTAPAADVPAQVHLVRKFYGPLLEQKYDNVTPRQRDLEQLELLAARFPDRLSMLAEIALDPPTTSEDFAGPPKLDEDYLILSTIHSAKGLEWDAVYVIHAADGNIPSDMSTGSTEQIEEERRLFYVALTRAKDWLYVCFPQRYFHGCRQNFSDPYSYAQLTRFIPQSSKHLFDCRPALALPADQPATPEEAASKRQNIRSQVRAMWS